MKFLILILILASFSVYATTGTVTASNLYLRTGPSTQYRPVSAKPLLPRGTTVTILEQRGSWYKINAGGVTGFSFGSYIRINSTSSGSNSNPAPANPPTISGGFNSAPAYQPNYNVRLPPSKTIAMKLNNYNYPCAIASYPAKKGETVNVEIAVQNISSIEFTCPNDIKMNNITSEGFSNKDISADNKHATFTGSKGKIKFSCTAPSSLGVYQINIKGTGSTTFDGAINIMPMHPFSGGYIKINGYKIGTYPSGASVPGFVQVQDTKEFNMLLSPHIKASEFICKQSSGYPKYFYFDPRELMKLELVREKLGGPIQFTSGFRTPYYNASLNGAAKASYHMRGMAYDFVPTTSSLSSAWSTVQGIDNQYSEYRGGGKKYNSFIHTDVRGTAARW